MMQKGSDSIACNGLNHFLDCAWTSGNPSQLGAFHNVPNLLWTPFAMFNDLRYAVRQLLKNPGFTAVAVLTLALGIGANTAIFSVVNGVLLRPLSFQEPERLVRLNESNIKLGFPTFSVAPGTFLDWQAQNHEVENLAAISSTDFNLTGLDKPERVS